MKRATLRIGGACAGALVWGVACTDGQAAYSGVTEPLQIAGAQFISGDLPGSPPLDGGQGSTAGPDGGAPVFAPLSIVGIAPTTGFIVSGISGVGITGSTTSDAVALGIRLANQGTGYWVIPGQGVVPPVGGEPATQTFMFSANFNPSDASGLTSLRAVAIGPDGKAGTQVLSPVCIESRIPDNGNACSPPTNPRPVPAAVFSLRWDTNFDVDLNVIVPSGLIVSPKTQTTTVEIDGGGSDAMPAINSVGLYDGNIGVIDRDSIGSCVIDGWRQEDLVFQDYPPVGLYDIYANPFASCGQSSVRFTLTIYEPDKPGPEGKLHATFTQSGELLASQTTGGALSTTGGAATGLFVTEKQFE